MARQTSHVIVPKDAPGAAKKPVRPARPRGQRRARRRPQPRGRPQLLSAGKVRGRRGPARHRGQVDPRGQGQPQRLLRPDQGRRGVSCSTCISVLTPTEISPTTTKPAHASCCCTGMKCASYSRRRRSRGIRSSPRGFTSATGGSSANWPLAKGKQDWDKRETERRREADREARPPSTPTSTKTGNRE